MVVTVNKVQDFNKLSSIMAKKNGVKTVDFEAQFILKGTNRTWIKEAGKLTVVAYN